VNINQIDKNNYIRLSMAHGTRKHHDQTGLFRENKKKNEENNSATSAPT